MATQMKYSMKRNSPRVLTKNSRGRDDLEGVEDVEEILDVEVIEVEEEVIPEVAIPDDDDVADDADVELALDEVLAETIRRSSTPEDDEEAPGEVDPLIDPTETILPKQDDEFRCASCRCSRRRPSSRTAPRCSVETASRRRYRRLLEPRRPGDRRDRPCVF